ncbi:hypothetical protein ACIGW7_35285 [Streptomyces sp. NPDC053253]|uniref:zinc ribbon domain-containing protein n=1 Tax=Streptomyces sp. NPDC053253 TaxID=3365699 RepID=UPI0037D4E081
MPRQAFRRDRLSTGYRETRSRQAEAATSAAEHRRFRARQVARQIIAVHGPVLVVEDCDIRTWYRLWGKRLSQTTPGLLIAALDRECTAAGGSLVRASTWSTALSQHCLCGERVKKALRDREHKCTACGLAGKRDLVSAALAAFVCFADVGDPKTAYLDATASKHAQITFAEGLEKPCGSQPHRARPPFTVLAMRQSHGNAVEPLLPEPPSGGSERPRTRHALCVTTPESPDTAPAAIHSSPSGELRIKS